MLRHARMLPIVNKRAVDLGITAGRMLNCHINRVTTFDKKSYYYPGSSVLVSDHAVVFARGR